MPVPPTTTNRENESDRGFSADPDYWPATRGNTRERMSDYDEAYRERPYGANNLQVEVEEDVVTLRGEVDTYRDKRLSSDSHQRTGYNGQSG